LILTAMSLALPPAKETPMQPTSAFLVRCKCSTARVDAQVDAAGAMADVEENAWIRAAKAGKYTYTHPRFGGKAVDPFVCASCWGAFKVTAVKGVVTEHECGPKCLASKGPTCECQCGGKNHGANYA
jgi:hypothetical protein